MLNKSCLATIIICIIMTEASGFINLFLDKLESNKLFGIDEIYYYVKDGTIMNHYNDDMYLNSYLYTRYTFNWSIRYDNVLYQISVVTNRHERMPQLIGLSIAKFGVVNDNLPGFTVAINCSGIEKPIKFVINMAFVVQRKDTSDRQIKLKIKRYTNCSENHVDRNPYFGVHYHESFNTPTRLGIALCAGVLAVALTSIFTVLIKRFLKDHDISPLALCYHPERTVSKKPLFVTAVVQSSKLQSDISYNIYASNSIVKDCDLDKNVTNAKDNDNDSYFTSSSVDTHQTGATPIVKRRFNDPLQIINEIQIPRHRITLRKLLLEGTFCQMYEGTLSPHNQRYGGGSKKVMIKTIADSSTLSQTNVLIKDGTLLAGLKHRNVCPVIAACTASFQGVDMIQPPWLIYKYTEPGNLKLVLRRNAFQEDDVAVTFSTPHLIVIAIQLLRALKYLHDRSIIHKDVATRNCFLNGRNQALLSDSALSRDLFPEDYQCLGDNENRPVKWLSVEALIQRRFGQSSDIWAFGILLWELVSKADDPYSEIDPFEMPTFLRSGYRLRQPKNCPDNLWTIMHTCWAADANKRPNLTDVMKKLKSFQEILTGFV